MRWVLTQHCSWRRLTRHSSGKNFSVILERTVRELNGESCISWKKHHRQNSRLSVVAVLVNESQTKMPCTRAVVQYAERAAEKLRGERQYCRQVTTFVRTSPFAVKRTLLQQCRCGKASIAHTGQPGHYCRRMQSLKPCLA